MSDDDEPVAKRTRQSLRCRNEKLNSVRERQRKYRENLERELPLCRELSTEISQMTNELKINRKGFMIQKCIGICGNNLICDCKKQQFQQELSLKEKADRLKYHQSKLWDQTHWIEHLLIEDLHPNDCTGSDECLLRMRRMLKKDTLSLERKQYIRSAFHILINNLQQRYSPLHDAIRQGHVKCVKFLLERGANVTSQTTEGETMFDSVYDIDKYSIDNKDKERLEILKLLLEYGVSSMFKENIYAGQLALAWAVKKPIEEFSLLLQHGAIMGRERAPHAVVMAWESFNLPVIKLLLLHHRNRLNFGPGSHVLCPIIIQDCYYKMILPGVPLDKCHEKILEALQFYKTFGGKFPMCSTKYPNRDLMQYLKSYKHRRHFDGVKARIKALISNPLSLKEISRLAVRKCIRKNYIENIKELPLPPAVQSFLRFDDVIITELPEEYDESGDYEDSSYDEDAEDSDMEL